MEATPFYEAARRIAEKEYEKDSFTVIGSCNYLFNTISIIPVCGRKFHREFFERYFEPDDLERSLYRCDRSYWLESHINTPAQNRQDRVIALLFADQMWKDGIR